MKRIWIACLLATCLFSTGCVGWGPQGLGHGGIFEQVPCDTCDDHCGNCDGYHGPFGSLSKNLACGSGCGEIYYGEWISNPPDPCNDCDTLGYASGVSTRMPWLYNSFGLFGYRYGNTIREYGNPLRERYWEYGSYGHPGLGVEVPCGGCGSCSDCHEHIMPGPSPATETLQPIPEPKSSPGSNQARMPGKFRSAGTSPRYGRTRF